MQTIIRYSLDGDKKSRLGWKLRRILEDKFFIESPSKTATFNNYHISTADLAVVMNDLWAAINEHTVPKGKSLGALDHFWMHVDKELSADDEVEGQD